jgi:ABC-type transport system substrate-binding protein
LAVWLSPEEMTGKVHAFDARVGGGYRMSLFYPSPEQVYRGKTSEREDRLTARFVELTPPTRIVQAISLGESVVNDLAAVGIRTRVRTMERAAFLSAYREKKLRGLILNVTAVLGNAANRIETFVLSTGTYAYGGYPDLDDLFRRQAVERDRGQREALLHQIQRLMHERVMHAPIFDSVPLHGVGPRVEEPAVGLNPLLYFTAPYEDMRLKRP